jgi:hypothetical protein
MPANIGAELQALPLEYLLGSPMQAAITAQALAAKTTSDFIQQVALEEDETTGDIRAVMIDFQFEQSVPIENAPGEFETRDTHLRVPLLATVQVPYLRINDLNVSFEFKIRDVQSVKTSRETTGSTDISISSEEKANVKWGAPFLSFFGGSSGDLDVTHQTTVKIHASTTYQSTERQSTDRSATFKMNLNAVQDPIPEGMQRVLQILSDTIQAVPAEGTATPVP